MRELDTYEVEDTSAAKLQVTPEGLQRFKYAKLAMSVHWGLYSLSVEGSEWIYFTHDIPYDEYRQRMDDFNPTRFDAAEWADLMVEAGMKFLLITSKHHDGFCLWDTKYTDFKVTNTPFRRDILAELADALHERGLGLHFYYSLIDWTYPAYRKDWEAYVEYYQDQLRELCTNFGQIDGILFDGCWPREAFDTDREKDFFPPRGPWDLAGTYDLIHELQPHAVITNNTHIAPLKGEDYQVLEMALPGTETAGYKEDFIGDAPKAAWWNLNSGWSYQPWNHNVKSTEDVLKAYRTVRAADGVLLLNVGPRRFGDIHPQEQAVLRRLGRTIRDLRL
ncbi:MAG: alpha-L-fucosidase [Planctomycetota bacterium]|jgi:alpha-L-fucosidase